MRSETDKREIDKFYELPFDLRVCTTIFLMHTIDDGDLLFPNKLLNTYRNK